MWRGLLGRPSREDGAADLAEAARRLRVRTRRQVTDVFAGHYVSAFRGAGIEYTESRPYVPGDDVRSFDWNATARTGVPHVKQHRPERGRTLIAAIDASKTMQFATHSQSKIEAACDAAALLATAALGVGDRFGLVLHDASGRTLELPPRGGELQLHRTLETLTRLAYDSRGPGPGRGFGHRGGRSSEALLDESGRRSDVEALLDRRRRCGDVVFRFSDARSAECADAARAAPTARDDEGGRNRVGARAGDGRDGAAAPTRVRGEAVYVLCSDPGELAWPEADAARIAPVAFAGPSLAFDGDDELARARFERAASVRVARVARAVRARGDDFVHFRTDRDPLRLWLHFFSSRAGGRAFR